MKNFKLTFVILLLTIVGDLIVTCSIPSNNKETFRPFNLRCEYVKNPLSINTLTPSLSWDIPLSEKIRSQQAYQILVSQTKERLNRNEGDLWNSGVVLSAQCQHIQYAGKPLKSGQQAFWKVRIRNQDNTFSKWSAINSYGIGLLSKTDWQARWIGAGEDRHPDSPQTNAAPYLRKKFRLNKEIKSARVYISGLGYYELYLNGKKVSDYVLAPTPTNYDRRNLRRLLYNYKDRSHTRVLYNTFDITNYLKKGSNVASVILGNGWYNQRDRREEGWMWYDTPRMIMQMIVEYIDGTNEIIVSDKSWKLSTGALLHDAIFTGEIYDARLEPTGWKYTDFDDSNWRQAQIVRAPTGKLFAQLAPADKVVRMINPKNKIITADSLVVFDFGEMFSGWVKIRVKGEKGTRLILRYFEELGGNYRQKDVYILNGRGIEEYEPRFTWHAFRKVEISNLKASTKLLDVTAMVVHTAVDSAGHFESSNELFNRIYKNYIRTQLGNFHGSFSSDCPHRERLGYTGDGQLLVESSIFNFDMSRFYRKWLDDMADVQDSVSGFVPHTAPFGGGGGGPAWGSSYVIVPWFYYLYYGDTTILEKHYTGMKHWAEYLATRTDDKGLIVREEPDAWCLGDWAAPGKVEIPPPFVNTCYYYYVSDILSKTAAVLHNDTDVAHFNALKENIKNNINKAFYNRKKRYYWKNRQGANAFPLVFGIVPRQDIPQIVQNLVNDIIDNKGHFDSGILATPLILEALTKYGREDIAFTLMNQRDYPGYGYVLEKNTTTLWEYWDGKLSHSHPMYGSVIRWFFKALGGINPDPRQPGFKRIIIKPAICGDLNYVNSAYNSIYGKIRSNWEISNNTLYLNVEIPANTTALIHIPAKSKNDIIVNTKSSMDSARFIKTENNRVIYEAFPGKYEFVAENIRALIKAIHVSTPQITPYDTLFIKPHKAIISITSATRNANIYYTLNGAKPDKQSFRYNGPLNLEMNTVIKAIAYKQGYLPSFIKSVKVNFVDPQINGIRYTVYEGQWQKKPNLDKIVPVSYGKTYRFKVKDIKKREDYIAVIFKSYLEIEQNGTYTFYCNANDGSVLFLDNKIVVDNAGYFGRRTDKGSIRLSKGRHFVKILYYENSGSESIDVFMEGPGIEKQNIPPYKLFLKENE